MIIDGFDYGDGYVPTTIICKDLTVWHAESNRWVNSLVTCQAEMNHEIAQNHMKYRRPMTEAEKQAEQAKEDKVIITIREISNASSDKTPSIPLSEAARIAQLPEVVAEVERQRKEREIKVGDWAIEKASKTIFCVAKIDGEDGCYLISHPDLDGDTSEFRTTECHKINDPAFIALLENGAK